MWGLLIYAGLLASTYIYHRWVEDHPVPDPLLIGVPRVSEGSPVPLIYGRCRVRAPLLAWAGGQRTVFIRSGQPAYFLDMLYVVGTPFYGGKCTLEQVYVNDLTADIHPAAEWETLIPAFEDPDTHVIIPAHSPNSVIPSLPLFPGDPRPSKTNYYASRTPGTVFDVPFGIITPGYGFVEFFDGSPDQTVSAGYDPDPHIVLTDTQGVIEMIPVDDIYVPTEAHANLNVWQAPTYFEAHTPSDIPSYRNYAVACLYHWCHGGSTTFASYSFDVTALSTGSRSDLGQSLPFDADPAAVILDLITSPFGKLGLPLSQVDLPSFVAASVTLFNENHGYSNSIESVTDAFDAINDILKQIDAMLYQEPTTSKLVLKLVRNDYDIASLDDVNRSNVIVDNGVAKLKYSIQGWSETINQVRLTFVDRENSFQDQLEIGQNGANAFFQGRLRSVDLRYEGCSTKELAQRICSRELAVVSKPQVKCTVTVNRTFHEHRPGDVVTWTWPQLNIDHMVMRIARIDLGQLHAGEITMDLIRDVFDVRIGAFPVPS